MYCNKCHFVGPPRVTRSISLLQILWGVFLCIFLPPCCFLPFIFDSFYSQKFYCQRCSHFLGLNTI